MTTLMFPVSEKQIFARSHGGTSDPLKNLAYRSIHMYSNISLLFYFLLAFNAFIAQPLAN